MLLGEDGMHFNIGFNLAIGADAVSAYFNQVAAVSFPTYTNAHLNRTVHYDRASAS
jgi:hypothetical protein